jgi:hypothetical protein
MGQLTMAAHTLTLPLAALILLRELLRQIGGSTPREIVAGGALEESLTDLIAAQPSPPAPAEGEKPSAAAAREIDARRLAWERAQLDMELTDSHRDAARAVLRKALEKSAIPHSSAAGRLVEALGLCE